MKETIIFRIWPSRGGGLVTMQKRLWKTAKADSDKKQGDDTMSDNQATIMDFSAALRALKNGKRIQRASWKNFKAYLYLMTAEDGRKLFALHTMDKMPEREWSPSCQDCFAEDWVVVE